MSSLSAPSDHLILFNDPCFHACNLKNGQESLRVDLQYEGRLAGTLSGVVVDARFESGHSAPFGGLDFVRPGERPAVVRRCIEQAVAELANRGIKQIAIRCRPDYFSANDSVVSLTLLNLGFRIEHAELSLGVPLDRYSSAEAYVAGLRSSARRALKHGLAAGLLFAPSGSDAEWADAYAVLERNRFDMGRQLKITLPYVMRLRDIFPTRVRIYGMRDTIRLVAAALVYRVATDVDYVVAWGDAQHGLKHSPMNAMAFHMVEMSLSSGARLLDLGIASVDGVIDDGLAQFKRHVGAVSGLRLDLVREVAN